MSKMELIKKICELSRGASEEFLSDFSESDLDMYLEHLLELDLELLSKCA